MPTTADVLSHTFTGAEPGGTYVASAYFTVPATDVVIGTVAEVAFVFAPEKEE